MGRRRKSLDGDAPADTVQISLGVPARLLARIEKGAAGEGLTLSRHLVLIVAEHYRATDQGVVLAFGEEFRDHLDTAAHHLGLDRAGLVRLMVSEGLPGYLAKAKALAERQQALVKKLPKRPD